MKQDERSGGCAQTRLENGGSRVRSSIRKHKGRNVSLDRVGLKLVHRLRPGINCKGCRELCHLSQCHPTQLQAILSWLLKYISLQMCQWRKNVLPVSSHLATKSIKATRTGQGRNIAKMSQALKAFESLVLDRLHRCLRENPDVFLHYNAALRALVPYCWQVNLNLTHPCRKSNLPSRPPQASQRTRTPY